MRTKEQKIIDNSKKILDKFDKELAKAEKIWKREYKE